MLSDADIVEALRACFTANHPWGRPISVVDLGMVESIALAPDLEAPGTGIPGVPTRQRLTIDLVPCTNDEDANAILVAQIENRMAGLPQLSRTSIRLLQAPLWEESRISPTLHQELHPAPPPFPILNNGRTKL